MKNIVYLFLFFIGITLQDVYVSSDCIYDKEDPGNVTCDDKDKGAYFDNEVLLNITKLQLVTTRNVPWSLKRADSFNRFYTLFELRITGGISVHSELKHEFMDGTLSKEFFYVKTLKFLYFDQCVFIGLGKEVVNKWLLPPSLERIVFKNCSTQSYFWNNVRELVCLEVKDHVFPNLAEVTHPSAMKLEKLYVKNTSTVFKIDDIAYLCHLKEFTFDDDILTNATTVENHCECKRYVDWIQYLVLEAALNLMYNKGKELKCSSKEINCSNYTLDKANENREKCLNLPEPSTNSESESFWTWLKKLPWYIDVIAGFVVLTVGLSIIMFMVEMMSSAPKSKISEGQPSASEMYDESTDDPYDEASEYIEKD